MIANSILQVSACQWKQNRAQINSYTQPEQKWAGLVPGQEKDYFVACNIH